MYIITAKTLVKLLEDNLRTKHLLYHYVLSKLWLYFYYVDTELRTIQMISFKLN